jgi:hypothetical protein
MADWINASNHRERKGIKELIYVFYAFFAVKQRRALFDAQDDIDRRREQLIAEIEGKLQQRASQMPLFSIRWRLG